MYSNLIHATSSSIKPEKELAYLALVTSQDEEEEQQSPDTQILPSIPEGAPPAAPTTSPMELDDATASQEPFEAAVSQKPTKDSDVDMVNTESSKQEPMMATETPDGVTEITAYKPPSSAPPPLPPRPQQKRKSTSTYTGEMMFGKQHDVSEAMDNCLFQIEACVCFYALA